MIQSPDKISQKTKDQSMSIKTKTVFVIDDSELFQFYIKGYLKHFQAKASVGLTLHQFLSGQDALANLHLKPDLILLDYYLESDEDGQSRNGDWVFAQIKEKSPDTKVVLLSQANEPEVIVRMMKLGLEHYVQKDVQHLDELERHLA